MPCDCVAPRWPGRSGLGMRGAPLEHDGVHGFIAFFGLIGRGLDLLEINFTHASDSDQMAPTASGALNCASVDRAL